jgi:hypothetical protein
MCAEEACRQAHRGSYRTYRSDMYTRFCIAMHMCRQTKSISMHAHVQNGFADSLKQTAWGGFLRGTFSLAAHRLKFLCTLHKKIEEMCIIPQSIWATLLSLDWFVYASYETGRKLREGRNWRRHKILIAIFNSGGSDSKILWNWLEKTLQRNGKLVEIAQYVWKYGSWTIRKRSSAARARSQIHMLRSIILPLRAKVQFSDPYQNFTMGLKKHWDRDDCFCWKSSINQSKSKFERFDRSGKNAISPRQMEIRTN